MSYFLTFKTIDAVSLQFAEADSELVELIMWLTSFPIASKQHEVEIESG